MHSHRRLEELFNIVTNSPLWPGDTVSHQGAYDCVNKGWAFRDSKGFYYPTEEGVRVLRASGFKVNSRSAWYDNE